MKEQTKTYGNLVKLTFQILIAAIGIVTMCGCSVSFNGQRYSSASMQEDEIPLKRTFWALHRERNRAGKNDCSNKSGRYAKALREQGYKANVVVISVPRQKDLHAVVELADGRCLDPAFGKVADSVEKMGEVKFVLASAASTWGREFR